MKKFFLLSILLLLAAQPAFAKWVFISKDGQGNSYFYEDTKVVKDPASDLVSSWQMISYVEQMTAPNGQAVYSVLQDISYFCRPGYESYKQFYLKEKLAAAGISHDFSFIEAQRGMFSYSGLTADQVAKLQEQDAIYALSTGRICVAALNSKNIDRVAQAIARVLMSK